MNICEVKVFKDDSYREVEQLIFVNEKPKDAPDYLIVIDMITPMGLTKIRVPTDAASLEEAFNKYDETVAQVNAEFEKAKTKQQQQLVVPSPNMTKKLLTS